MKSKILIVTGTDEPNVQRVIPFLRSKEAVVVRMDTDIFLRDTEITFLSTGEKDELILCCSEGEKLSMSEVRSVWYRRPPAPKARPDTDPLYRQFAENESGKFLWSLWSVLQSPTLLWVNHPLTLKLLEYNKLYQLRAAAKVGFPIPETLVTNSESEAVQFCEKWGGRVALKTFGGNNLKDGDGSDLVIYTQGITKRELLEHSDDMKYAPVMLENYIPKKVELRVTIVGNSIFACSIHSQDSPRTKDDWRKYDFPNVRHEVFSLPQEIQGKLLRFMKSLNISFGAIDMILTPNDDFVFLEVNPSGQWGWIEAITGMPISEAIANLLANPKENDGGKGELKEPSSMV